MAHRTVTIMDAADAVARLLASLPALSAATVRRAWAPQLLLSELRDGMVVSVVPAGVLDGVRDRAGRRDEFRIEVGVQAKLASGEGDAAVDALAAKVLAARDALADPACLLEADLTVKGVTIDPLCADQHLTEHRVFTSLLVARVVVAA